jgi:putative ABC transport system substrate-binding protein
MVAGTAGAQQPSVTHRIAIGRMRGLVGEVLDRKPGVIFSATRSVLDVLKTMATAIPVGGITIDPVGSGMAASLARPGGNITGLTLDTDRMRHCHPCTCNAPA